MKLLYTYIIALLVCGFPAVSHAMDKKRSNSSQQKQEENLGTFPMEMLAMILKELTPKSGGYVFAYTQKQGNKFIATFAALRLVCQTFYHAITISFTHEEWSNIYYSKLCTYSGVNTDWLYLVAKCVGPKIQCPSCLLSDWKPKAAKNRKFPDNKIPREYFLAHVIHGVESENTVLSVLKTLVAAGTQVTFAGIEIDEWLFNCVAHAAPLYNAINREFSSVVTFLVNKGAPIDSSCLAYAQHCRPRMYELLIQLQKEQKIMKQDSVH